MAESGGVPSLSVTISGQKPSREGRWRRERDTRAWTRGTGQKRGMAAADAFYGGPVEQAERKKGRGSRGSAQHGGENGEERGGTRARHGTARWPASAPGQLARVAGLWHNRGGRGAW
jgi:hypothetical protein